MAKEMKFRPATMAEIEERDTDLYMNGERVWVFMINRSQTIGEDDAKLIDIVLTNMKHVQPEDLQVIDDTLKEQDELPESPLMRYYGDLKSKHKDAILLFRCGDFYETYYEDAHTVAKLLGITLTRRGGNGYYMAGFPHHALDTYLPRIIRAGHRVAICDGPTPDDDPKGRKSETKETTSKTNQTSETMAKEMKAADLTGKVLVLSDGKSKYVIKSVDGDKLAAEFSRGEGAAANVMLTVAQVESMISAGKAQWSDDEPDPEAVGELVYDTTSETVEEVEEVSAITPTKPVAQTVDMKPKKKSEGRGKKEDGRGKKEEGRGKKSDVSHQPSALKYETYQNKKGKTCARIVGFREDDAAYQQAAELHASATYETKKGEKVYLLIFGPRYAEAAKEVCQVLNEGKTLADCKAIIDKATADRQQQREEWKARRAERNAQAAQPAAETTTGYTDKDVAEMLKKIMAGEAIPENIKAAMAA